MSAAAALSATASDAADRSSPSRIAHSRRAFSSTSPPRRLSGSSARIPRSTGSTFQVPATAPSRTSITVVGAVTESSSRPSSEWTTRACSAPSSARAAATSGWTSLPQTPSTWRRTPAGLVRGPEEIEHRPHTEGACAPAPPLPWPGGAAGRKETRSRPPRAESPARRRSRSSRTPRASRTSADPHFDETDRLPCLATGTPPAAATRADAVEMLMVSAPSPPVPQVSMAPAGAATRRARARMARAAAATSVPTRPWRAEPPSRPATWA